MTGARGVELSVFNTQSTSGVPAEGLRVDFTIRGGADAYSEPEAFSNPLPAAAPSAPKAVAASSSPPPPASNGVELPSHSYTAFPSPPSSSSAKQSIRSSSSTNPSSSASAKDSLGSSGGSSNRASSASARGSVRSSGSSMARAASTTSRASGEEDVGMIAAQLSRALLNHAPASAPAVELHEEVFRDLLDAPDIDVDELRRVVWAHGVPDRPWARPVTWKLLAGYLPSAQAEWEGVLAERRSVYWGLVAALTVDPSTASEVGDHPLCVDDGSRWAEHFRDRALREVIDKDVVRTLADLHRFSGGLRDALRRILFVYSKSASGTGSVTGGYRQGMNELAAVLVLCFAEAPFADPGDAEADAYFCLCSVMEDMATVYAVKETEKAGIGLQLRQMQALLRIKDPRLDEHLSQLGIDPRFYALRWIRLWLAREFLVPDVLRFWDSFLAAEVRLPWIRYVCVAMLIRIREDLLACDFTGCMKLLLHYPAIDVPELLSIADRLRTANVTIVRSARRR